MGVAQKKRDTFQSQNPWLFNADFINQSSHLTSAMVFWFDLQEQMKGSSSHSKTKQKAVGYLNNLQRNLGDLHTVIASGKASSGRKKGAIKQTLLWKSLMDRICKFVSEHGWQNKQGGREELDWPGCRWTWKLPEWEEISSHTKSSPYLFPRQQTTCNHLRIGEMDEN